MHSHNKAKFQSNHSCKVCQERVSACISELGKLCCSSPAADRGTHAKQVLSELPHKEVLWSSRVGGWRVGLMTTFLCPKNTENPETILATKFDFLVNNKLYRSARQEPVEEQSKPRLEAGNNTRTGGGGGGGLQGKKLLMKSHVTPS
jgi:hypothetical protein